jgi:hypothetical protein
VLDLNQRLSAYEAGELPGCSNLPESYLHAAITATNSLKSSGLLFFRNAAWAWLRSGMTMRSFLLPVSPVERES